jgi:hypothetical protein
MLGALEAVVVHVHWLAHEIWPSGDERIWLPYEQRARPPQVRPSHFNEMRRPGAQHRLLHVVECVRGLLCGAQ